ncbi:MAG: MATE family efflux transporter [Clostridia bacterium]|nr:MATE family efflux transporter [Clostridia bacterium]
MNIQLSDHFNYKKMLRFTLPSIIMMIFTSIYGVVDGFFVSNYVGKTPFAAINFIMPVLMILGALGFMFGTGGSALISKYFGEGNSKKANSTFSMLVYITIITGIAIALIGIITISPVASLMGAKGQMHSDCVLYSKIILAALPFFMLQVAFQTLFVTAQKPVLGLYSTVISGITNMILDALFMAVFGWGIAGAALATAIAQAVGGLVPIIYFVRPNTSLLRLSKPELDFKALFKICTNGSSELMTNLSMSIVGILYNLQLMKYAGENGIAAYGVLMYVNFVFLSAFIGFSVGIAPVVSFHFGAKNHSELKSLLKKSMVVISIFAVSMFILAEVLASPLSHTFVGYDADLTKLTLKGFLIFSFSFLFAGYAIFISAFFTALNDGLTSAIISFLRSMVFQIINVIVLPVFWGINGIWISVIVAEFMAVLLSVMFLIIKKKKYNY